MSEVLTEFLVIFGLEDPINYYVKVRTADSTKRYKSVSKEVYDTIKVGSYFSENKLKK